MPWLDIDFAYYLFFVYILFIVIHDSHLWQHFHAVSFIGKKMFGESAFIWNKRNSLQLNPSLALLFQNLYSCSSGFLMWPLTFAQLQCIQYHLKGCSYWHLTFHCNTIASDTVWQSKLLRRATADNYDYEVSHAEVPKFCVITYHSSINSYYTLLHQYN